MDARRRVEFTGGSRTVTTIDQRQHRPDGLRLLRDRRGPFMAAGIMRGLHLGHAAPATGVAVPTITTRINKFP
jgi:hypothetical protein